jgi:DNA-binding MarR family transcriptional regulator
VNNLAKYELDDHLCFQLYQASRAMTRLYKDILDPLHLTYPQYIVMVLMWDREVMPFKEMSDILRLKTGTLSPLLQRLEKDGWVKRKHNKLDDRMVEVHLGKTGLEYREKGINVPCEVLKVLDYDNEAYLHYLETVKDLNQHIHDLEEE